MAFFFARRWLSSLMLVVGIPAPWIYPEAFTAALSFALRERGLELTSSSVGRTTRRVRICAHP